jgi:hypothetical protein
MHRLLLILLVNVLVYRAAALSVVQFFFESHPMNPNGEWDARGIPYQLQLCDKEFLRHCLIAMRLSPRSQISRAAALLLRCASNVSYVNAAIADPSVRGVKQILDAISSTSHDNATLLDLVTCISNIAAFDDLYIMRIAEESGLELLQPVVLHDDPRISLLACVAVASVACLKDCAELVEKSQSLPVVENVLRAITPGSLVIIFRGNWNSSDSKILHKMMSPDAGVAVQLTALHYIASSFHMATSIDFFNTPICHVPSLPFTFTHLQSKFDICSGGISSVRQFPRPFCVRGRSFSHAQAKFGHPAVSLFSPFRSNLRNKQDSGCQLVCGTSLRLGDIQVVQSVSRRVQRRPRKRPNAVDHHA